MKKILLFAIILSILAVKCLAQALPSYTITPDTSKLENFAYYLNKQREIRQKQSGCHASDEVVKSWYYSGENMTYENGEIEYFRSFNENKLVSYPVKSVEIFNKVLRNADMLFEYTYSFETGFYNQYLFAKFNGKYYSSGYFNYLLENIGVNEQTSVEDKIECAINWAYWLSDQNIEMLEIEQTKEQMPYDTIINTRLSLETDERIAVNVHHDYKAEYFGHIIFEGKEMEFYATIVGDKKFIKSIYLFEPGTKDSLYEDNAKYLRYNLWFSVENYNYKNDDRSENRSNSIFLYLDGTHTALQGITQGEFKNNYVAYYYPDNSNDNYTLHLSGDLATSDPMQIKLCHVTGATVNENIDVWTSEKISPYFNNGFDISNKVSSGFYLVKFMFASNNWQFLNLLELS